MLVVPPARPLSDGWTGLFPARKIASLGPHRERRNHLLFQFVRFATAGSPPQASNFTICRDHTATVISDLYVWSLLCSTRTRFRMLARGISLETFMGMFPRQPPKVIRREIIYRRYLASSTCYSLMSSCCISPPLYKRCLPTKLLRREHETLKDAKE